MPSHQIIMSVVLLLSAVVAFYILAFRVSWRKVFLHLLTPVVKRIPPYISPNHITAIGVVFPLAAGAFIYLAKYNYFYFLWAILFLFVWGVTDNLDGILASARNQATKRGAFLDYTLDKVVYLFLLFTLILGDHVRAELVVITMLFSLLYSLINMESQALTGRVFTLADRPRGLVLANILCLAFFLLKLFGADVITLLNRRIKSMDVVFAIMPVYAAVLIIIRSISLWKELKEIDDRESHRSQIK